MLLTHFYLMQGRKMETRFVSASRVYFGIKLKTFLSTNWQKKDPLVKWTGVAIKISVAVRCRATPVSCANVMNWGTSKRCSYLKNVALDFVHLVSKLLLVYIAYPWRFASIEFDFVNKILDFEIESWLYHLLVIPDPTCYHWIPCKFLSHFHCG